MYSAPAVSYPVGRCRLAAGMLVLAWLAGIAAVAAWMGQAPAPSWQRGLAAATLVSAGLFAALGWWRSARGTLTWNGARWAWDGDSAAPGTLERMLDLQRCLLVRWRPESGAAHWLWLEQHREPRHWDAVRRAVYSRATIEAPQSPPSPPAKT